jgi:hypothetical protein
MNYIKGEYILCVEIGYLIEVNYLRVQANLLLFMVLVVSRVPGMII